MAGINIGKAPANKAVLPFYGAAAVFFILLAVTLLFHSDLLLGGYFNFRLLSIVHLTVVGWLTMLIFGAGYQLLPVICERDLYSELLAFLSFWLLLTGIVLLGGGFWYTPVLAGRFPLWGLLGGLLIFIASGCFVLNVGWTSRICKSYNIQKTFILTAACWLSATTLAGFLLAWNLRYPYIIHKNHLELLKLHVHMGLAGWFLQLIIGVSAKLIPMFLLGKSNKTYLLRNAYILINAGMLLFLIDGYFFSVTARALLYLLIVIAGIGHWLLYLRDVYKNRIKRPIDVTLQFSGLSFVNLMAALVFLTLLLTGSPLGNGHIAYGILAILGWISALGLGMTFKTLPFIVWNGHYKHLNGKGKIPLPKELYRQWLVNVQWWLFVIALYALLAGVLWGSPWVTKIALIFLTGTSLSYGLNVLIVLKHKTNFIHATSTTAPNK
ncbi:Cytochrome C and Quinol oxidase polypeptide I [Arachidicoccus rhizosphaerae]|uniref:Cytochrome C and Quinol oxidase polypeptide I n=1 Tax=Arachidicoccus rhizosphaerae TaxID=551991 RepID=A0A1H3W9S2_9BACT|nr:cbb3-type cytochrome c oxidase subunit I [Arachidicoccus rhizosphaerae]SDZ83720.1 Cytochrome C and Quinol oxidase polypeptide I [Arachidicoccus rhizosphaerae]